MDIDLRICERCKHFEEGPVWLYCNGQEDGPLTLAEEVMYDEQVIEQAKWFITASTDDIPDCPFILEHLVINEERDAES